MAQQIELLGRFWRVEGGRGGRIKLHRQRLKVFGTLTNAEARALGMSRNRAWKCRRDGFFWLDSEVADELLGALETAVEVEFFGRTMRVEARGLDDQRLMVFGSLTGAEAKELGLSKQAAERSRRNGYLWLTYRRWVDNSRPLSAMEVAELERCAAIGATRAWLSAKRSAGKSPHVGLAELVREAEEWLASNSARREFADERWRIRSSQWAAMLRVAIRIVRPRTQSGPGSGSALVPRARRASSAKWTRSVVVARAQEWAERYGKPPSALEWNPAAARARGRQDAVERFYAQRGHWPTTRTVADLFGTWSNMLAAAEAPARGPASTSKP